LVIWWIYEFGARVRLQIAVDVPRTLPEVPFFQEPIVQATLKRILYIWYATVFMSKLLWFPSLQGCPCLKGDDGMLFESFSVR